MSSHINSNNARPDFRSGCDARWNSRAYGSRQRASQPDGERVYQGKADVAVHPENGNFLTEFKNNVLKGEPVTTYSISANSQAEPPFARREDANLWLEVTENPDEAKKIWNERGADQA